MTTKFVADSEAKGIVADGVEEAIKIQKDCLLMKL